MNTFITLILAATAAMGAAINPTEGEQTSNNIIEGQ